MALRHTRRGFLAGAAGAAAMAALPRPALARPRFTIYRIAFRGPTVVERGFADAFRVRGIEAEVIERDAARDAARVPAFVEEAKRLAPDLVYTWGTPVTLAAFGRHDAVDPAVHIDSIPGVFVMVAAPVLSKVVPSLESSGRNLTGVVHTVPIEAQLKLMRSYLPFDRLAVIYTRSEPNSLVQVEEIERQAQGTGFRLIKRPFPIGPDGRPDGSALDRMVAGIREEGADCLLLPADTFLTSFAAELRAAARREKLLTFAFTEFAMRSGMAVAGIVSRDYSVGQLAGHKAAQILVDGTPPAGIPVERLKRFSLMLNIEFAKEIGVFPPLDMIESAEIVGV